MPESFPSWDALRAVMASDLSHHAKLVAVVLIVRANKSGECFPAYETIASDASLPRSSAASALAELRASSGPLLVRVSRATDRAKGGRPPNRYKLTLVASEPGGLSSHMGTEAGDFSPDAGRKPGDFSPHSGRNEGAFVQDTDETAGLSSVSRTDFSPHSGREDPHGTTHDHDRDHGTSGSVVELRIPKPTTCPLRDQDFARLEVDCPGLPRAFAELAVRRWLGEEADPHDRRLPRQWRTHARKVAMGSWDNPRRRRELLAALEETSDGSPPPVTPEQAEKARRDEEIARAKNDARLFGDNPEELAKYLAMVSPERAKLIRRFLEKGVR